MAVYTVEIGVPDELVDAFEEALSGDDNDILLAAEYAMNRQLDEAGVVFPFFGKIELDTVERIG